MYAGSACLLEDTADGILHIFGRNHHQISQFVDDNDDEGHCLFRIAPIEGFNIPNTVRSEDRIAFLHLLHRPVQHRGGFLRISHNRHHEMRDTVIVRELYHLRVDQYELHLIGCCLEQDARDQRVDADGFS